MEDTMSDIFGSNEPVNDQINIPTSNVATDTITVPDIFTPSNNQAMNIEQSNVISMQDLINEQEQNSQKTVVKKKDKVLMVQLALIIAWIVLTVLVYYFGYDFFAPYIDV